ncbi:hypothetical protein AB3S75_040251 [Citrus x aurantiifolia]
MLPFLIEYLTHRKSLPLRIFVSPETYRRIRYFPYRRIRFTWDSLPKKLLLSFLDRGPAIQDPPRPTHSQGHRRYFPSLTEVQPFGIHHDGLTTTVTVNTGVDLKRASTSFQDMSNLGKGQNENVEPLYSETWLNADNCPPNQNKHDDLFSRKR